MGGSVVGAQRDVGQLVRGRAPGPDFALAAFTAVRLLSGDSAELRVGHRRLRSGPGRKNAVVGQRVISDGVESFSYPT